MYMCRPIIASPQKRLNARQQVSGFRDAFATCIPAIKRPIEMFGLISNGLAQLRGNLS